MSTLGWVEAVEKLPSASFKWSFSATACWNPNIPVLLGGLLEEFDLLWSVHGWFCWLLVLPSGNEKTIPHVWNKLNRKMQNG